MILRDVRPPDQSASQTRSTLLKLTGDHNTLSKTFNSRLGRGDAIEKFMIFYSGDHPDCGMRYVITAIKNRLDESETRSDYPHG
jgi:hypothetical protein